MCSLERERSLPALLRPAEQRCAANMPQRSLDPPAPTSGWLEIGWLHPPINQHHSRMTNSPPKVDES